MQTFAAGFRKPSFNLENNLVNALIVVRNGCPLNPQFCYRFYFKLVVPCHQAAVVSGTHFPALNLVPATESQLAWAMTWLCWVSLIGFFPGSVPRFLPVFLPSGFRGTCYIVLFTCYFWEFSCSLRYLHNVRFSLLLPFHNICCQTDGAGVCICWGCRWTYCYRYTHVVVLTNTVLRFKQRVNIFSNILMIELCFLLVLALSLSLALCLYISWRGGEWQVRPHVIDERVLWIGLKVKVWGEEK